MKLKMGDKEIYSMLQGHVKTSFKDQMYLVFVTFITLDTITIYHTIITSSHSCKMLQ